MEADEWHLSTANGDPHGFYRLTLFSISDVYLYVIKDSAGVVYYEFREHVIPNAFFWRLDYSKEGSFRKSNATSFEFDIEMLDRLPKPDTTFPTTSFFDPRDKKIYRIVTIGNQTWMAENLNYVTNNSWCYGNDTSNCNIYGRLYTWADAMNISSTFNTSTYGSGSNVQHQGICPSGWRLPNDNDWRALTNAVGSNAGTKLKSQTGLWNTGSGYIPGTDEFGFSALPGGYRFTDGSFRSAGSWGHWWSATEDDASYARDRGMYWNGSIVRSGWNDKSYGFSVRCLKNQN